MLPEERVSPYPYIDEAGFGAAHQSADAHADLIDTKRF
jgi:hypothetical protein